jgi:hypothetical protein
MVYALADGRTMEIRYRPMPDGAWVATHEDITERRKLGEKIAHMATHDMLTGLPNRVLFRERLDTAVATAQAGERGIALLMLDLNKFKADMRGSCMEQIQKEQKEMQVVGVGATPGFFINGRFLSGAQPIESFQTLIDEELKKAKERIASGTPQAAYYKTWIVDKGEKAAEVK